MSFTSVTIDPVAARPGADVGAADTETVNANLYLVLARAFASPTGMAPSDCAALRDLIPGLPIELQSCARSLAEAWEQGLTHDEELALAYARLFLGPFEILASPYASFYLEHDQQLMGPVSQAVAAAYGEAGLVPGPGPREAPDHVSLEWEFMYFLTHQFVVTGESRWLKRREDFVSEQLLSWMPTFAAAIKRGAVHPFYDALATLLTACLRNLKTSCGDGSSSEDRV